MAENTREKAAVRDADGYIVYRTTISAAGQRERKLVVTGTREQVALLIKICTSMKQGSLIQDMGTLLNMKPSSSD